LIGGLGLRGLCASLIRSINGLMMLQKVQAATYSSDEEDIICRFFASFLLTLQWVIF
jgi:hypothetical protein